MRTIDLRSDTVTKPIPAMYDAMATAHLGDDVYQDDPTVNKLERIAAELLGKEASLFVPSGTMGNLLAVLTHTSPGQEMILGEKSHIYLYEVAGMARIAGVQARTIFGPRGQIPLDKIAEAIRPENIHFPETGLIALENTHNMYGGAVLPLEYMKGVYTLAQNHGIPVHLDGARVFNAARSLKVEVQEIAQYADSVMFCLSKGLCAPVGSMLVGTAEFIEKARKHRKMLGGGLRQVGILAACGIVALQQMVERLDEDHENAKQLAQQLLDSGHFITQPEAVKTNIVNAVLDNNKLDAFELIRLMADRGVLANARSKRHIRFVTHNDVSMSQISDAVKIISHILA